MKKYITILLVLFMTLSLAACGPDKEVTPGSDGVSQGSDVEKKVVVGIPADPESWAPWERMNNGRRHTMPMVYQTLTADTIDPVTKKIVTYNVMIEGYEKISDDTYEVYVREGIYDTAGNPFKASDAVFTIETVKEKGALKQVRPIDHLKVIDDYTFQIVVNEALAVGDFGDILSAINMVTQASYEASPDGMATNPVGTAGYVLSEYVTGSHAVFTKSEKGFWNEAANESKSVEDGYCFVWDTTKLDTVQFEFITDPSTMVIALETGDIDLSTSVASKDLVLFKKDGPNADKFYVHPYPDEMYSLSFNCSDQSVCSNINLRRAIAHCVDSQALLDVAYSGDGVVAKAWSYPTMMDYQKKWDSQDYFKYDPELAKQDLQAFYDETGTKASDLKIRLLIFNKPALVSIGQMVQAYIAELVGNETCCEILNYDQSTYNTLYEDPTAFDVYINYCPTHKAYSVFAWNEAANEKKRGDGTNQWFVDSDELQKLLEAAIDEKTHSDETVSAFQDYINDHCYQVSLIAGSKYMVVADWVETVLIGPKDCVGICGMDFDWTAKVNW
jgi:ABC-type transport system substrate-binding protein